MGFAEYYYPLINKKLSQVNFLADFSA